MSAKNSAKNKARKIQKTTGIAYTTALQIVRGELGFFPQSTDCLIAAALKEAGVNVPYPTNTRACMCPRCDPEP